MKMMATINETQFPLLLASNFTTDCPPFEEKTGNSSAFPWVACMMSLRSGGIAGAAEPRGIGRDETILDLKKNMFSKKLLWSVVREFEVIKWLFFLFLLLLLLFGLGKNHLFGGEKIWKNTHHPEFWTSHSIVWGSFYCKVDHPNLSLERNQPFVVIDIPFWVWEGRSGGQAVVSLIFCMYTPKTWRKSTYFDEQGQCGPCQHFFHGVI